MQLTPIDGGSSWKNIVDVTAGYNRIVGLRSDGVVISAGTGTKGRFDDFDGEEENEYTEKETTIVYTDIVAISQGYDNTVGLRRTDRSLR